jgi:hypothetical protein
MLENSRYNYFDGDLSSAMVARLVSPIQRLLNGLPQNCYPLLRPSHKPIPSYNDSLRVVLQHLIEINSLQASQPSYVFSKM